MYGNVSCPRCGSTDVDSCNTMVERNFTMCYVTYYKCRSCGEVWEPKRFIDLPIDGGRYLKVPDGSTLVVIFPDGEEWRKTIRYLDSHHFDLNGGIAWHVGQFRDMLDKNPGTKVTYEEPTGLRASKDVKRRAPAYMKPRTNKNLNKKKVR